MASFFFTLEGSDGTGKSLQAKYLFDYLTSKGLSCVLTSEPGGTELGKYIRELILFQKENKVSLSDKTILLLFLADRVHHIETVIKPALDQDKVVICDRFFDSTIVYQGIASGIPMQEVSMLVNHTCSITPDATVLLDMHYKDAMVRKYKQNNTLDSIEMKGEAFFKKVSEGYRLLAKNNKQRIYTVDASKEVHNVLSQVLRVFNNRYDFKLGKRIEDKEGKFDFSKLNIPSEAIKGFILNPNYVDDEE